MFRRRSSIARATSWSSLAVLMLALPGCATVRVPTRADSAFAVVQLERASADYWRHKQERQPELGVRTGVLVDALPDPTQRAARLDAQFARRMLVALDDVDVEALAQDDYVTWQLIRWDVEMMGAWSAFHWTDLSAVTPGRSWLDRVSAVLALEATDTPESATRFRERVRAVASMANTIRGEFIGRRDRGIRLTPSAASRAATHIRSFIRPVESSPFAMRSADSTPPWRAALVNELIDEIANRVNPALDSLAGALEPGDIGDVRSPGLSRFPGGGMHYAVLLRFHTTVDVTPETAHAIGVAEVARSAARVEEARRAAGLPAGRDSLRAVLAQRRLDQRADSLLEVVARLYQAAATQMDSQFLPVAPLPLSVGFMAAEREHASPLVTYEPPTISRAGARFALNASRLATWRGVMLPTLVFRDLMPGLHILVSAQEQQPDPARRYAHYSGFEAGWQSYVLSIADSLAPSLTPLQRFALRLEELASACGLVIDTGLNALGWTRDDAIRFLVSQLPEDEDVLEREFVMAAIEDPGRLSAAAMGARELRGLRQWTQQELGERFDPGRFHREVLRVGSVPLPVLGSHLERWMWDLMHPNPPAR